MAGLYIHIPFCRRRCNYCDFYFTTDQNLIEPYLQALSNEITSKASFLNGEMVSSIYFGGGTPSLLSQEQLHMIFQDVHAQYNIAPEAEITIEANPEDCKEAFWPAIKSLGINRLSLGVQSFNQEKLSLLHRKHTGRQSHEVAEKALVELPNVNIDLIFGAEGETLEAWQKELRQAIEMNPQHISPYSLTLEEKTPFYRMVEMGKRAKPNDELQEKMYVDAIQMLKANGYRHYEVSNFARPGFQARHNLACWKREPYLGFGPAAHSYYLKEGKQIRQANQKNIKIYINQPLQAIDFREELSDIEILNEEILLGLRQECGVSMDVLKKRCKFAGSEPIKRQQSIEQLEKLQLIKLTTEGIYLTEKGFTLADSVAEALFV